MKKHLLLVVLSLAIISVIGIGAGIEQSNPQNKDMGIGPVKNVVLGTIDKKMADEGKIIFTNKCAICHEMDQKKVGPPLRNITKERTPEYIMNLLLNSAQMQKEDPIVKKLLKDYNNVPMPDPAIK
ncbi:MAG: cytochrome c [Bacteroidia bacterium]|nr:cytochrome c [Bacteroidia bacterium]